MGILDVSGQKNKDLFRLRGIGAFQAKRIRISTVWGILDVSGQKNNNFSRLGDFGCFRTKE